MNTLDIVFGIIIGINLIMFSIAQNWPAVCGWSVAGLEWFRRISTIGG